MLLSKSEQEQIVSVLPLGMSTSDAGALRTCSAQKQFVILPLTGVAVRTM